MFIADLEFLKSYGLDRFFDRAMSQTGEIFREVKDRRTLRFESAGQYYFIKQHFGVGLGEALKNIIRLKLPVVSARNEWSALNILQNLGILAPQGLAFGWSGVNPLKRKSFIVMREIKNHTSLENFTAQWSKRPPARALKRTLIRRIAEVTRLLHQNGINHRDYYICHFWLDNDAYHKSPDNIQLTIMDWHRAQIRKKVPTRWLVKDLASLLFSVADLGLSKTDVMRFVRIYWQGTLPKGLFNKILKRAQALYFRDFGRRSVFLDKTLPAALSNLFPIPSPSRERARVRVLSELMQNKFTQILKNGDTTTVILTQYQNQSIVIKRYNHLKKWHALKHCLKSTRAARSWFIAHEFQRLEIPTAKPLMMAEECFGPSYFVMQAIEGDNLRDLFLGDTLQTNEKITLARKVVALIEKVHANGIVHRDLKATNIIVKNGEPMLIDLDAAHYSHWAWFRKHKQNKDLKRFMKNWQERPDLHKLFRELFQERQHFGGYAI